MNGKCQLIPFADRNADGYRHLLYIEVALRELARYGLRKHYGDKWQQRIPGHYLTKIRNDQKDEATKANLGFRRLGPLYYLTFGELVDMSIQKPIVEVLTRVLGQQGPELLREIIPSRNAIAHCRDLTENAFATVRVMQLQMAAGLTAHNLLGLLQQPDIGLFPEEAQKRLVGWFKRVRLTLNELQPLSSGQPIYQEATCQYWWSSSKLAGFDIGRVGSVANSLLAYSRLPGGVGAALARQRFISESKLLPALEDTIRLLEGPP